MFFWLYKSALLSQNTLLKTLDDAFYNYYIQYLYFKNVKKKLHKIQNNYPVVRKSTNQVDDYTLDTCLKCGSYPIKTVGGDRFWKIV